MKKFSAVLLISSIALLFSLPLLSGCGGGKVNYTLSDEGGKHYIVSCSGLTGNLSGEYEILSYFGEGEDYAPVTEIAEQGFSSCGFSKITVPETVTKIGTAAFSFSYFLKTVEFKDGINLSVLPHGVFGRGVSLETIVFPDSVVKTEGLIFSDCQSLKSVTLNSGLTEIGTRAFENCTALEEIVFPSSLKTIGTGAFYNSGLKEADLPESLQDTEDRRGIGYSAFNSCTNLETVRIRGGVQKITSGAFGYCKKLKSVYIPLSVKEIEGAYYKDGKFLHGHAFHNDEALTYVYYGGTEEQWKGIKIETKTAYENNLSLNNEAILNAAMHYNQK